MIKYNILFILFSVYGCTEKSTFDLNFAIQIMKKSNFIYTIESSQNGSSLKWIKKYDKNFRLIKEYELNSYGTIAQIREDTIFFHLYVSQRDLIPSQYNIVKWDNEFIKFEKINVVGFLTEKELNVNDFRILIDDLVFETTQNERYNMSISDIKCDKNEFFTQRFSDNQLLTTKIKFHDKNLKNKFISILFNYWQKKMS